MSHKLTQVHLEWEDSASEDGYWNRGDKKAGGTIHCCLTGYLVRKDRHVVVLARESLAPERDGRWRDVFTVPRRDITVYRETVIKIGKAK